MRNLLARVWSGIKQGWQEPILPECLLKIERNIFVQIFKIWGAICVILVLSDAYKEYNKIMFYSILISSLIFTIYSLILIIYSLLLSLYSLISQVFVLIQFMYNMMKRNVFNLNFSNLNRLRDHCTFINILSLSFLLAMFGYFVFDLYFNYNIYEIFVLFISTIISGVITTFVWDKFKFSEYLIIRWLQKFIFFIITFNLIVIILYYLFDIKILQTILDIFI